MGAPKLKKTKSSLKRKEDEYIEGRGKMSLEKEDVKLILNALNHYKPTKKEKHQHAVLLEKLGLTLAFDSAEVSFITKTITGYLDPDEIETNLLKYSDPERRVSPKIVKKAD